MREYLDDRLRRVNRPLLIAMLKKIGKDFTKCEQCGQPIKGKFEIHHTKYKGATIYDLQIVCSKCNKKPENKGLK